ncbi:MAG: NAD(P)/FAD-dependent oxidoreductase [Acidimicrobiia bacterium]
MESEPAPRRARERKVVETPFGDVVVVGASLGGLAAVEGLRRAGYGGRITVIGAEPHLPYDRPPLSKSVLAGTASVDTTALRAPAAYDKLSAEWKLGRPASGLDLERRVVRLADGEDVPFEALVIATGASVRTLPNPDGLDGIFVLRTLDDCLAVRTRLDANPRVAVVGAGFIGMEVAATCRSRGLEVDVVEAMPVPLSHTFGPLVGSWCQQLHLDHGVRIHCGATVERFCGNGNVDGIRLSDGTTVPADLVVVGIGVVPETGWLEGSGLELDNGVVVDETCATQAPYVVACGDVARWPNPLFDEAMRIEHWTNAIDQGHHAAKRLVQGESVGAYSPVPYVWSDQYDVRISFLGRARPDDEVELIHGSVADRKLVALYGRQGRLVGAFGFNYVKLMAYSKLIAARAPINEARTAVAL